MNMRDRPDLVQGIEILDGQHFYDQSLAEYCFSYTSAPDGRGFSHSVEGEVFADALVVHGGPEIPLSQHESYKSDELARRLVATALFGYERSAVESDVLQGTIDTL